MCQLKGSSCIHERLEEAGKSKGPCYCILRQAQEKRIASEASIKASEQYDSDHLGDQGSDELRAKTLEREDQSEKGV